MNYKSLINKIYQLYIGDICEDELIEYFIKWAKKNKYPLPKMIEFLESTSFNLKGDIVPIILEDEDNIYYNDSCHRYCYLEKSNEGMIFKYK